MSGLLHTSFCAQGGSFTTLVIPEWPCSMFTSCATNVTVVGNQQALKVQPCLTGVQYKLVCRGTVFCCEPCFNRSATQQVKPPTPCCGVRYLQHLTDVSLPAYLAGPPCVVIDCVVEAAAISRPLKAHHSRQHQLREYGTCNSKTPQTPCTLVKQRPCRIQGG